MVDDVVTDEPTDGPSDQEVVETASEAAEGVVMSHYSQSELKDLDITVTFEDGMLEVDVYLNPVSGAEPDADAVADEAALAAQDAVDELFDDA